MSSPRIAIIIYSLYGHIAEMAESVQSGIVARGGNADIIQVPETLPDEVFEKMEATKKQDFPIADRKTLTKYDAFLFGIPTRFGNMPAQLKTFWDATGRLWKEGTLNAKYAGMFVSTEAPGGGQEATVMNSISTLTHHGIIFVPFGYATGFESILDDVPCGGSPWGAGTFAGRDHVLERELKMAKCQGMAFYDVVSRVRWGSAKSK